MNATNLLLRHNLTDMPSPLEARLAGSEAIATVLMNLSYYGKALSTEAYGRMIKLAPEQLGNWWARTETELKSICGADRKMGDFVVYKNFPAEVLSKTEAEYWIPQILMYWGVDKKFFTEPVQPRDKMNEQPRCTVLHLSKKDSLSAIFLSLLKSPARWKDHELADVLFLAETLPVSLAKLSFKENMVLLAQAMMTDGKKVNITTATDVLRLAAGLSDGDVSLREKGKFISFKKNQRRFLLSTLEKCGNVKEDMARRPELWKRLMHQLHPGDYARAYPSICQAADDLYNDRLLTFNSQVERALLKKDPKVLELLASRPGDFRRRLAHCLDLFGTKAVKAFSSDNVISKLTTAQVVSLRSYLETIGARDFRTVPPKGNWSKLKVMEPRPVAYKYATALCKVLSKSLSTRVPTVKVLDPMTCRVKLPSNGGDAGSYTRGTSFPIPDGIQFIRTGSYWKVGKQQTIWFDNGWNFFDTNWKSVGAIAWNNPNFGNGAAAFSGDPLSSKDVEGRACQVIDLYLDKLVKQGIRYAVWNVLCFSGIPFNQVEEVFSTLQWGEDAQKGKLFEPSRAQLSFPLTGESKTKYICLIDLVTREMVYLDANLPGNTSSAMNNGTTLEKSMPAFMEYVSALPSVHDLFRESVDKDSDGPHVLYSDKDTELKDVSAYVFKPENKDNKFKSVDINPLLD